MLQFLGQRWKFVFEWVVFWFFVQLFEFLLVIIQFLFEQRVFELHVPLRTAKFLIIKRVLERLGVELKP